MKSFLYYVAEDLVRRYGNNLSGVTLVFPNKRASLYFEAALAEISEKPVWSPSYSTIADLFMKGSRLALADGIKQVCVLYKVYKDVADTQETLDHFFNWGQILISDFDEIDKSLADARIVFSNISDLQELKDMSYLTDEQKEILGRFWESFNDRDNGKSDIKSRFLYFWDKLYEIYRKFNSALEEQGLGYEGAIFRNVLENNLTADGGGVFAFVGFNVLNAVEKELFKRYRENCDTLFYWDYDKAYLDNHEAGWFMASNIREFGNALEEYDGELFDNFSSKKAIRFVSASSANAQAGLVDKWLSSKAVCEGDGRAAVVLCDESLLVPILYNIPDGESVNVTIGYPLQETVFNAFMEDFINVHVNGYNPGARTFASGLLMRFLKNPCVRLMLSECSAMLDFSDRYFVSRSDLPKDENVRLLLDPIDASGGYNANLIVRLMSALERMAGMSDMPQEQLWRESLYKTYMLLKRIYGLIGSGDLEVDGRSLLRIIKREVKSISIPFHGEELSDLQIMGILETRNLDFKRLLILSCTEGNMPKNINDKSFIPYNIRKANGLMVYERKLSIYSYYFFRLLQRATDVTIAFDNSSSGTGKNDMSRFMLQMLAEFADYDIERISLQTMAKVRRPKIESIAKDDRLMEKIHSILNLNVNQDAMMITPSFLNTYIRCRKLFFYKYICNIKESENKEAVIDQRIFGSLFHKAAELFYAGVRDSKNGGVLYENDSSFLEECVNEAIRDYFNHSQTESRNFDFNGYLLIQRRVIQKFLKGLVRHDRKLQGLEIVGLEQSVGKTIDFDLDGRAVKVRVGGIVDRIDSVVSDGKKTLRVIDYKTGANELKSVDNMDLIFRREGLARHGDYYLQSFLYSVILRDDKGMNPDNSQVSPNIIHVQKVFRDEFASVLSFNGNEVQDIADLKEEFEARLVGLIKEILDPDEEFAATEDHNECSRCAFRQICEC